MIDSEKERLTEIARSLRKMLTDARVEAESLRRVNARLRKACETHGLDVSRILEADNA